LDAMHTAATSLPQQLLKVARLELAPCCCLQVVCNRHLAAAVLLTAVKVRMSALADVHARQSKAWHAYHKHVRCRVYAKHHNNLKELWEAVQQAWGALPDHMCKTLMMSLTTRKAVCLERDGGYTGY